MTQNNKITVFGATGKVGAALLQLLSEAGVATVAVTRNKSKARDMPNVEWLAADMEDKQSLHDTMRHSAAVFLASSPGQGFVTGQSNVIDVAVACGVDHIVKLSSAGVAKDSPFFLTKAHYEVEELLKASGMSWTILRPNAFMQNWLGELATTIKAERRIYQATGDGKKPFIDVRDIAAVAYTTLTAPAAHNGQTYLLTGGEAISYSRVAEAISKVIGEEIAYIPLSQEEARIRMEQQGMPVWGIQTFLSIAEAQRMGKAEFVNDAVHRILNRQPITVEEFAADNADSFR